MPLALEPGSRVAVLGGGPAGSLCAYFLLSFAQRMDLPLNVDIYEPRDFAKPGPLGCNMCGGIVSESLIQALAIDGINLPPRVVQRGVDSYILHTDRQALRIETPLREKRIAAVYRGGGPRDAQNFAWQGLDGFLLRQAQELGARVVPARVAELSREDGRPRVHGKEGGQTYDLLVGATGVNSAGWQLYEQLGFGGRRPQTTKTYITEIRLGFDLVTRHFGSSMHMFLLNIPHLDFAAIIPKGDYVTVCLLGNEIDAKMVETFLASPAVRDCFPSQWEPAEGACHCSPKINVGEAVTPFSDRVVLVGDCGVSRLYKDGVGAAYRTAKAAAATAMFGGVGADDFARRFLPVYRRIARDNQYGHFIFSVVHQVKGLGPLIDGMLRMAGAEQARADSAKRMSMVLWDMFTGSAPYREVFFRTLDPRFDAALGWHIASSLVGGGRRAVAEVVYGR